MPMTETEFHEECGMPISMHALTCPGPAHVHLGMPRPTTAADWVTVIEWALQGLREEMSKT